jgi:hypothetical protein
LRHENPKCGVPHCARVESRVERRGDGKSFYGWSTRLPSTAVAPAFMMKVGVAISGFERGVLPRWLVRDHVP